MHTTAVYIDSFTTSLDDMPSKDKSNPLAVLEVLKQTKKFSVFDLNGRLEKSIEYLVDNCMIETSCGSYPWTYVNVLPK